MRCDKTDFCTGEMILKVDNLLVCNECGCAEQVYDMNKCKDMWISKEKIAELKKQVRKRM